MLGRTVVRPSWLLWCAVCLTLLSGCQLTREQQLIGRWYNSEMSIRFRPDGGVIYNSPAGKAIGVYYFTGTARPIATTHTQENLVLDVVRNGQRLRMGFEAELISADRLRLYDLTTRPRISNEAGTVENTVVLKRASEKDTQLTM